MAPKKSDVKVLKGQDAEVAVHDYLRRMNRPFGAVDVSSNLKGAVPKTAVQKILLTLAEKGDVTQKLYGKTTFFVANQTKIEHLPAEKLAGLETEHKRIDEENKLLVAEVKAATAELSKLKNMPTDAELSAQVEQTTALTKQLLKHLEPLRTGASVISADDIVQLDSEWTKWKSEWTRRRKVFKTFWQLATDSLPPQAASELAEDLGIEHDTSEHELLERSPLCNLNVTGRR